MSAISDLTALIGEYNLLEKKQAELDRIKAEGPRDIRRGALRIYTGSLYVLDNVLYCIAMKEGLKQLYLIASGPFESGFEGKRLTEGGIHILQAPLTKENSRELRRLFPFTVPVSLRNQRTTIGCGDRLGMASAAHLRAIRQFDAYPVLAQQSIRELNFTGRDFEGVVADASFLVFQEGYEEGWGADGDHLKTIADIDSALDAGMPMITLDLTEVLHPEAAGFDEQTLEDRFSLIDDTIREYILAEYVGKKFSGDHYAISFSYAEAVTCTLMYWDALEFAAEVDAHLRARRGDAYDLEISIDETTSPTLPAHHLFITRELHRRNVAVNSLAPRFIGDFQKAVDYIGDPEEFEQQFIVHCGIARSFGAYKISVHSGSDKFTVYPYIGRHTGRRLHLKTAGTSWLEAVHAIARTDPQLFRLMYRKALGYFPEALKSYHITADLSVLPDIDTLQNDELEQYFDLAPSRQLLHITYGGLLKDPEVRGRFFTALNEHEDVHYGLLEKHFVKHLELLRLPRRNSVREQP